MNKLVAAVAYTGIAVAVMQGGEGCTGGKPIPNVNDPKQGTAQCAVTERQVNSNGTEYLVIDCGGGGKAPGSGVRSLMEPAQWPMCRVGAAWPGCKG